MRAITQLTAGASLPIIEEAMLHFVGNVMSPLIPVKSRLKNYSIRFVKLLMPSKLKESRKEM